MAATVLSNPSLKDQFSVNQGNVDFLVNFLLDNQQDGVIQVLNNNGIFPVDLTDAAKQIKTLLLSPLPTEQAVVSQLATIPYNNNTTNGTGGITATIDPTNSTLSIGDSLLCLGSQLLGLTFGCDTSSTSSSTATAAQLAAAQQAATQAAADAAAANTKFYATLAILVIVIIGALLYFNSNSNKKKEEK